MLQTTDSQMTSADAPTFRFDGIRVAQPSDEDELVHVLMTELHAENGIMLPNADRVLGNIRVATRDKKGVIGIMSGDTGIEATIGLFIENWWYTDTLTLNEKWCHVRKPFRRSDRANRMIEFSKRMSEWFDLGLFIGIISNEKTAAKVRLYRRRLPQYGAFFYYHPGASGHQDGVT